MADIQTGIALTNGRGESGAQHLEAPEGFLLAEFDASGQEMRLMADESQDEMMLKLFLDALMAMPTWARRSRARSGSG